MPQILDRGRRAGASQPEVERRRSAPVLLATLAVRVDAVRASAARAAARANRIRREAQCLVWIADGWSPKAWTGRSESDRTSP